MGCTCSPCTGAEYREGSISEDRLGVSAKALFGGGLTNVLTSIEFSTSAFHPGIASCRCSSPPSLTLSLGESVTEEGDQLPPFTTLISFGGANGDLAALPWLPTSNTALVACLGNSFCRSVSKRKSGGGGHETYDPVNVPILGMPLSLGVPPDEEDEEEASP